MLVALQELQCLGPPPPPALPNSRFSGVTHVSRAQMGECAGGHARGRLWGGLHWHRYEVMG